MSLSDHARAELKRAGLFDDDSDYDGALGRAVMDLIDLFALQGHSGFSAIMTVDLFNRLARYQPLTPLTDDPDEWMDVDGEGLLQNRRDSECFSQDGGKTYRRNSDYDTLHTSEPRKS